MALQKPKALARRAVRLHDVVEKPLNAYMAAAAATGVSLLALTPPAECKIVYTPADISIPTNAGPVPLDLNHDGVVDFSFSNFVKSSVSGFSRASNLVGIAKQHTNGVWGRGTFKGPIFGSALRAGRVIEPSKPYFLSNGPWLLAKKGNFIPISSSTWSAVSTAGQWLYTKRRFLGLKFLIGKDIHYGWARFDVTVDRLAVQATLTGYAYETVANKPIIAGKTKGPDVITLPAASLGRLARGASAVPTWRKPN